MSREIPIADRPNDHVAPTRVYVAAPFTEWPLVREVQAEIRRRGGEITCDWTLEADKYPSSMTDADAPEEVALTAAVADVNGVLSADACLFLTVADKSKGCGMWVELGAAVVSRQLRYVWGEYGGGPHDKLTALGDDELRIAVVGPMRDRTIFTRFGKRFSSWLDALPYVLGG